MSTRCGRSSSIAISRSWICGERPIFCDTTVLCNFASVRRLNLLESILAGRGRWVAAVAYEVERHTGLSVRAVDVHVDSARKAPGDAG